MTGKRGANLRGTQAKTFRSSAEFSPSMCCRPTSKTSIPTAGSPFCELYCALTSAIGAVAEAHYHRGIETIAHMLERECTVYYSDDLQNHVLVRKGEQCFRGR
jgi:uncharacterized RmlC-like cupin family protein